MLSVAEIGVKLLLCSTLKRKCAANTGVVTTFLGQLIMFKNLTAVTKSGNLAKVGQLSEKKSH